MTEQQQIRLELIRIAGQQMPMAASSALIQRAKELETYVAEAAKPPGNVNRR